MFTPSLATTSLAAAAAVEAAHRKITFRGRNRLAGPDDAAFLLTTAAPPTGGAA
jgi:hypothetical protein